ncbi:hypothetical protein BH10CYA1_BH10CYA1_54690 [soil metagenome]
MYRVNKDCSDFRLVMYSKDGLLPCVRVHMEKPHTAGKPIIEQAAIDKNIADNNGFLELDFLFQKGFKEPLRKSEPKFYKRIKDLDLESFVDKMMSLRDDADHFALLRKEYKEAEKSIKEKRPIYWKEMLAALSFAMNYPAKYLSAEDMLRLRNCLSSLISVVIAFMPQRSCQVLLALHDAGRLALIADGGKGEVEVSRSSTITYSYADEAGQVHKDVYQAFVNCTGQEQIAVEDFPFRSLVADGTVHGAKLLFKSSRSKKRQRREKYRHRQRRYEPKWKILLACCRDRHLRFFPTG